MFRVFVVVVIISLLSPTRSHENIDALEAEWQNWVSNSSYKARNAKYQGYCENILRTGSGSSSQFGQDVLVFFNTFKYWPMLGRTGFYVDSGANDAVTISNTYFFDVCLGWEGVCVEPLPQYHAGIMAKRSCKLSTKCISDVDKKVFMNFGKSSGANVESSNNAVANVDCSPLHTIIGEHFPKKNKVVAIDLWSLDVEGYEMTILQPIDFNMLKVKTLLIEDMWLNGRKLDYLLLNAGFVKMHQFAIDSFYVSRAFLFSQSYQTTTKMPYLTARHYAGWAENLQIRSMPHKLLQVCDDIDMGLYNCSLKHCGSFFHWD